MRRLCSLVLGACLTMTTATAIAAPSAAERETARRLMDEGKARLKANDALAAIERFQKAHEIMHVPTTGVALARAHLAAGHLVEARDLALEVMRSAHEPGEPAVFEGARKQAREIEASVRPRIPTVRVTAKNGTPAHVYVDGVELAPALAGEPIAVNPGKRIVSVKNAEGGEAKAEVELSERDTKEIELALPAPGESSKVSRVIGSPGGPASQPAVRGFGNEPDALGQRTPLATGMIYGGFAVAAVGLGAGLVSGALTLSTASDVKAECENGICARSVQGDLDSANTLATVANIALVVGAVGAVVGVVGFVMPRRSASTNAALVWTGTGLGGRF